MPDENTQTPKNDNELSTAPLNSEATSFGQPKEYAVSQAETLPNSSDPIVTFDAEKTEQFGGPGQEPTTVSDTEPATGMTAVVAGYEVEPATQSSYPTTTPAFGSGIVEPAVGLTVAPTPKKFNKKIIAIAAAAVIVLLTGSGAAAYNLWYQNPEKVIGDALGNAMTSKSLKTNGQATFTSKTEGDSSSYILKMKTENDLNDAKINAVLSGKAGETDLNLDTEFVVKGRDKVYLKVNNLKETLDSSGLLSYLGSSQAVNDLITKLDGNWVVLTKEDIEDTTGTEDATTKCVEDVMKKLQTDKSYANELRDLYIKNPLVAVKEKLGNKNGSFGYVVELNRDNAVKFTDGVNDTKFYKALKKCDDSIKDLKGKEMFPKEDSSASKDTTKLTVWVDRWSHNFTKLEMTSSSEYSDTKVSVDTDFNVPVKINAPTGDMITMDELKADIEKIQAEYEQTYSSSSTFDDTTYKFNSET